MAVLHGGETESFRKLVLTPTAYRTGTRLRRSFGSVRGYYFERWRR